MALIFWKPGALAGKVAGEEDLWQEWGNAETP